MRAVLIDSPGRNSALIIGSVDTPKPGTGEILVRIHATAINRADLLQRRGLYAPPPGSTDILGLEMAGIVESVGAMVKTRKVGDRVAAILPGGGYAEYVAIPESLAIPIPQTMSFSEAAAIPEAFLTSHQLLNDIADLRQGETVLIHAGASGIGTAAIQLAKLKGAKIFCTASSAEKLDYCRKLGADITINYRENQDFSKIVISKTNEQGVDIILDCIGKGYLALNLACIALDGRYVLYGLLGGMEDTIDLGLILRKRVRLEGTTLRNRSETKKTDLTMSFIKNYLPCFESGQLKPIIYKKLPIGAAEEGHRLLMENSSIGKVILETTPDCWK